MNTVIFEKSARDGAIMTRWERKIAFATREGPSPQEGEEWEVIGVSSNPSGNVFFLKLGMCVSTEAERLALLERRSQEETKKQRDIAQSIIHEILPMFSTHSSENRSIVLFSPDGQESTIEMRLDCTLEHFIYTVRNTCTAILNAYERRKQRQAIAEKCVPIIQSVKELVPSMKILPDKHAVEVVVVYQDIEQGYSYDIILQDGVEGFTQELLRWGGIIDQMLETIDTIKMYGGNAIVHPKGFCEVGLITLNGATEKWSFWVGKSGLAMAKKIATHARALEDFRQNPLRLDGTDPRLIQVDGGYRLPVEILTSIEMNECPTLEMKVAHGWATFIHRRWIDGYSYHYVSPDERQEYEAYEVRHERADILCILPVF